MQRVGFRQPASTCRYLFRLHSSERTRERALGFGRYSHCYCWVVSCHDFGGGRRPPKNVSHRCEYQELFWTRSGRGFDGTNAECELIAIDDHCLMILIVYY